MTQRLPSSFECLLPSFLPTPDFLVGLVYLPNRFVSTVEVDLGVSECHATDKQSHILFLLAAKVGIV